MTTIVPTLVTGVKPSSSVPPTTFSLDNSYARDEGRFNLNQALPQVDFPDFDGSTPKLWFRNCESYFDIYTVLEYLKVKIASMHFTVMLSFGLSL